MNTAVERALRALAEAGIGGSPASVGHGSRSAPTDHSDHLAPMVSTEEGRLPDVPISGHEAKEKSFPEGPRPGEPSPEHSRTAEPDLPDSILMARNPLKEICRLTLEGNPEAHRLSPDGRRWVAEQLEAAVLRWLSHVLKPEPAWDAVCPKGHRITDGIFARVLMGWCCPECEQVYPAGECKLRRTGR